METFQETVYNKLVRDKIIEILRSEGHYCFIKKLASTQYKDALTNKLKEEVSEYMGAKNEADQLEELGDVLEVIHAILKEQGKSFSELESIRHEKCRRKGGFEQGIFLERSFSLISENHCRFCVRAKSNHQIVSYFTHCFAIWDEYPVSKGHLLIIPYKHYTHWFDAPKVVQLEITSVLDIMRAKLDTKYHPDGYNIGINCGVTAGQTIMHLHVHLIPRYEGDMPDPRGGVRGVIPEKQKYDN